MGPTGESVVGPALPADCGPAAIAARLLPSCLADANALREARADDHERQRRHADEILALDPDRRECFLPLGRMPRSRQMVALDIHDWKSGDMPTDPMDPGFARRRAEAGEALLANPARTRRCSASGGTATR